MNQYALITTLVGAIVLAFVFGFAAQRLKLSPIVGYLLAGVAVGPYTPGFEADLDLAMQLSEIGVILLMFGVGLKISVEDIWSVRWAAVPSSVVQTVLVALLGAGVGLGLSMPLAEALTLGSALSIASTIVLMRMLEERRLMKTEEGRVAVSFVLLEDLFIVIAIVVLPALVGATAGTPMSIFAVVGAVGLTLGKIAVFAALMLAIGGRLFPWLIVQVAHTKSRELLSLGTLALALGVAWAAYRWFDASFALGAFLGGLALNGSRFSHKVGEDSLPLRDTFAVLFFVAVGMLFDPGVIVRQPLALAAIATVATLGKAILAYAPMRLMGQSKRVAALVALGTAQIGEFSFMLAGLGRSLGVMSQETYNLILGAALISIAVNPFLLRFVPDEKRA
ncbi:MAG TPA: potassium transporter Kef [Hyphomonadaceae bacterium]|nr:potassium transporter Kef [Hyphomonadaceae bacterium]